MKNTNIRLNKHNLEVLSKIESDLNFKLNELPDVKWNSLGYKSENGIITRLAILNIVAQTIPEEIFQLNLTMLSLVNLNLKSIDDLFFNIKQLQELYIGGNKLRTIPTSINQLKHLRVLYILEDDLQEFPIINSDLKSLSELSISSKFIKEVPKGFKENLPENCRFYFNNNEIK